MLLVGVAGLAHPARERDTGALLHHVRCLVCGRVKVGGVAKGDVLARGVCLGADPLARVPGRAADVCLHAAEIVRPERRLDTFVMRQTTAALLHTGGCGAVHRGRLLGRDLPACLHGTEPSPGERDRAAMGRVHPGIIAELGE